MALKTCLDWALRILFVSGGFNKVVKGRCDDIISAAQSQGVVISTIFPSRFHESCIELKRAVDERRFGRLTLGDAYVKWFRTQEYYDSGEWRGTWDLDGGGALMNQSIHAIDAIQWIAAATGAGKTWHPT